MSEGGLNMAAISAKVKFDVYYVISNVLRQIGHPILATLLRLKFVDFPIFDYVRIWSRQSQKRVVPIWVGVSDLTTVVKFEG
jgi:hypothetical protein